MRRIETIADLETHYGEPSPTSLSKVSDHLTPTYRRWIELSRFCIMSTVGSKGTHGTPRGDIDPVIRVADPKTILLPDWKGNNRLDALRDIVEDPRIAFLFMVPGSKTTVRVNGRAWLTDDADLRASFEKKNIQPATVIVTEITVVYSQCAKAIMRSALWGDQTPPDGLPSAGEIIADMTKGEVNAKSFDDNYGDYAKPRLW